MPLGKKRGNNIFSNIITQQNSKSINQKYITVYEVSDQKETKGKFFVCEKTSYN